MIVQNLFNLQGKTAIVTGGSRGLGMQIVEALAEQGALVIVIAKTQNTLDTAKEYFLNKNLNVVTVCQDLFEEGFANKLLEKFNSIGIEKIDILVNNAAVSYQAPIEETPIDYLDYVMSINLRSVFLLTQLIGVKYMIPQNYGKIINISSITGLRGTDYKLPILGYNTSKGALNSFTKSLACEWGRFNITVNAIAPGFFLTDMSKNGIDEMSIEKVIDVIPLNKIGDDFDLKGSVVLFASEASKHITGQILPIDGGVSAKLP